MSNKGERSIGGIGIVAVGIALTGVLALAGCSSDGSEHVTSDASGPTTVDAGGGGAGEGDAGGHHDATATRVLNAYGGESAWKNATTIKTTATVAGALFQQKGKVVPPHAAFTIDVHRPHVVITPIDADGNTGILDGFAVTIQSPNGTVLDHRDDARQSLQNATVSTPWDELNLVYFVGYALWGYNTLPALLTRTDVQWTELQDGVLQADFGTSLPVHSQIQRYWFDGQSNLLTRNDYSPVAAAVGVKVANLVLDHGTSHGIPYPSTRRVRLTPDQYGTPQASPDYITIDVDSWELQ